MISWTEYWDWRGLRALTAWRLVSVHRPLCSGMELICISTRVSSALWTIRWYCVETCIILVREAGKGCYQHSVYFIYLQKLIPRTMFSITVAHELGHNFGAEHDDPDSYTCSPGLFPPWSYTVSASSLILYYLCFLSGLILSLPQYIVFASIALYLPLSLHLTLPTLLPSYFPSSLPPSLPLPHSTLLTSHSLYISPFLHPSLLTLPISSLLHCS